jgi:hypothetical protein
MLNIDIEERATDPLWRFHRAATSKNEKKKTRPSSLRAFHHPSYFTFRNRSRSIRVEDSSLLGRGTSLRGPTLQHVRHKRLGQGLAMLDRLNHQQTDGQIKKIRVGT